MYVSVFMYALCAYLHRKQTKTQAYEHTSIGHSSRNLYCFITAVLICISFPFPIVLAYCSFTPFVFLGSFVSIIFLLFSFIDRISSPKLRLLHWVSTTRIFFASSNCSLYFSFFLPSSSLSLSSSLGSFVSTNP